MEWHVLFNDFRKTSDFSLASMDYLQHFYEVIISERKTEGIQTMKAG